VIKHQRSTERPLWSALSPRLYRSRHGLLAQCLPHQAIPPSIAHDALLERSYHHRPVPLVRVPDRPWLSPRQYRGLMTEKRVVMIADGPQGASILFSDGSTEPVPGDDEEPPPILVDIFIEETRAGFEVWISERMVQDHEYLIDEFQEWLLEQPEVVSTDDDTVGVVQVLGVLDHDLRSAVRAWWASRLEG